MKGKLGAPMAIGEKVADVQKLWQAIYNLPPYTTQYWDRLFKDGDTFKIGSLDARVMLSAGHTLASITYVVGNAAFIHDTMFQPDSGTARCDFPGGSAATLYDSIQRILALPDETRLFTGHDYRPNGRPAHWESTVAQQKQGNTHVGGGRDRESYVALREARDKTLPLPDLMLAALQVNLHGGRLPEPEGNGRSYLKIPVGAF
jgi:glyoxylase-like metal-dependent hydrolase (beta-lactamase superfamily II)